MSTMLALPFLLALLTLAAYVDRLYAESEHRAKFISLAIHPYISGQPFRIKYLEAIYDYVKRFPGVVFWTGEEMLDWFSTTEAAAELHPRHAAD